MVPRGLAPFETESFGKRKALVTPDPIEDFLL